MKTIQKHHFEAVSLLTPENGMLEISIIPALGQPNWIVPRCLILDVQECHEQNWHTHVGVYHYKPSDSKQGGSGQNVPVYPLVPKEIPADKMIILEGNTDAHRIALQSVGEIVHLWAKISDVKDVTLDEEEMTIIKGSMPVAHQDENYVFQAVQIGNENYIVPDLDLMAHRLLELSEYWDE